MTMPKRRFTIAFVATSVLASLGTAPAAHAQQATARALFEEGRAFSKQGHWEEACDRFARSQALEPGVGKLLNLGDCNEHLSRFASAWIANARAEELARRVNDDRIKDAQEALVRLEPKIARLVIEIDASAPGLVVTRNGAPVDRAEYNVAIPVDPGVQNVTVSATGRKPWHGALRLAEGEHQAIHVPALDVVPIAPAGDPYVTRRKVALGLEIGGGGVLVGGVVFGALALGTWSSVTKTCPDAHCPNQAALAQRNGDAHTASTFATISTIAIPVGAAALATGIVLHLTTPRGDVGIAPRVDPTGAGIFATIDL